MAVPGPENSACARCKKLENFPSSYMESRMEQLKVMFKQVNIHLEAPCTETSQTDCWILSNLLPWNKVLHLAGMELKEVEPGRLAIAALNLDVCGCCDQSFLHDASFLTYLLITEHRCVQYFKPHPVIVELSGSAFTKALASNAGLRHFEYRGSCKWRHEEAYLAEGVSALRSIEHLHLCNISLNHSSAVLLADMFEKNKSLKGVTFSQNSLTLHSSEILLRALRTSATLTALAFDNNYLGHKAMKYLGQLVAKSQSLKRLSLKWSVKAGQSGIEVLADALKINTTLREIDLYGCDNCAEVIAEALKENKSLKVLTLTCCAISNSDAVRLAGMIECNSTLQVLDIASNNVGNLGAEALAASLSKNKTLQKLCLLENSLSARGIRILCAALGKNSSLRVLDVGSVLILEHDSIILNGVLRQANAYGRVRLNWQDVDLPELSAVLAGNKHVEEIQLDCTVLSLESLRELLSALCINTSVTKLHLRGQLRHSGTMQQLIKVINSNKSIRYLNFDCHASQHTFIKDFIEALKHNKSIIFCDIYIHEYTAKIVKALSALISENKAIASLVIHHFPSYHVGTLSKALQNNYMLTRLDLGYAGSPNKSTFRIGEALRRNSSLLKLAAQFALHPSIDKAKAQIFEKFAESENILCFLMQLTRKNEDDARKLVHRAKNYIASNFFKIAGVVKYGVQCEEANFADKIQIDQLNEATWLKLLSYIEISDVFTM